MLTVRVGLRTGCAGLTVGPLLVAEAVTVRVRGVTYETPYPPSHEISP